MTVAPEDEYDKAPGRDFLGWACHLLHIAVVIYAVAGWTAQARAALIFYLAFLPAVALHWQLNENACVLNNLESLIRGGRWRDPANREEGVWLLTLAKRATGLPLRAARGGFGHLHRSGAPVGAGLVAFFGVADPLKPAFPLPT